jgi:hypothetical protein
LPLGLVGLLGGLARVLIGLLLRLPLRLIRSVGFLTGRLVRRMSILTLL